MGEDNFHLGVKALIRNKEGKVLLLKVNTGKFQKGSGYNGQSYWDIPGGRIKKGDSIETTLKKEVEEETGIKQIESFKPFSMVLSNIRIPVGEKQDVGLILASYLCDAKEVEEIKLSKEHTACQWFTPQEAAKLLFFKYPKEFTDRLFKLEKGEVINKIKK